MTAPPSVKGREAPVHTGEISENQGIFLFTYVLLSAFSYTKNLIGVLPSCCFCDVVVIFWSVSWGSQTRTRAGTGCVYPPSENPLSSCQLCVQHTQPDSNPGVKPSFATCLRPQNQPGTKNTPACYLRNSRVLLLASLCNNRPQSHLSGKGNRVIKAMVSCEAAGRPQQQVGTTPSTGTASPPALQAAMLNSVSHHRLSQLWAGWGTEEWWQAPGDASRAANPPSPPSPQDTVPWPGPSDLQQPPGPQGCSCFVPCPPPSRAWKFEKFNR